MKRYSVKTFNNRFPLSLGHRLYKQIKVMYSNKERRGGIIVFPVEIQNFDNSIVEGRCSKGYYFSGEYNAPDGTFFGKTSICIDACDLSSGDIMLLAMKCSRIYQCTVLLKDIDDCRLFSVHCNASEETQLKLAA